MIAAFAVLLIIALVLGVFIAYMEIREKKLKNVADTSVRADIPPTADEAPTVMPEAEVTQAYDGNSDEITQIKSVEENGAIRYIVIKYNKSFLAKLIQSGDETKRYYSALKNSLLAYDGVKSRISWKWESFRLGRKTLAKLRLRGKTLSLCLALDVDDYADSKYKVESLAEIKDYVDTPCMYRIKNDRRLKYAEELISALMEQNGTTKNLLEAVDYVEQYPYETTDALIGRNLIKVMTDEEAQSGTVFKPSEIRESISVNEVDSLMQDEIAASLIENSYHR